MDEKHKEINRRDFLKTLGAAGIATSAVVGLAGCDSPTAAITGSSGTGESGEMTYRTNRTTGDKVSIL
ncbi:MAG: twin-arginine translocation signal domain-containing protein, partial [Bacteroidales bacterium]|nr:twin-arginine translocation signal domain-containing protein [Bacteroidales bacterium]